MVLEDTYEGMFSDPEYGGNRDYAGWKLVGYPGAQRAYTAYELRNGPQHKRVQGLRDMPPMNPGVPQDHVILPLAGTRPERTGSHGDPAQEGRHGHDRRRLDRRHARREALPAGHEIVSLEQGPPRWTWPHFAHDHDSLRYSVRYALMVDLHRETWTWRPNPRSPALPMRQYGTFNPGMGLGGAAVHWSAQLWRYLEYDFRHRSHIVERYGASKIPAGSTVQDWGSATTSSSATTTRSNGTSAPPGSAGNLNGEIHPGRQPVRGARAPRLPEPPLTVTPLGEKFAAACREPRAPPVHPAGRDHVARLDRPVRQPPRRMPLLRVLHPVRLRGRREGKPAQHALPDRPRHGPLRGPHERKVLRIETDANGLATGVTYVDAQGASTSSPPTSSSPRPSRSRTTASCSSRPARPTRAGSETTAAASGKNYTYQIYPAPVTGVWEGEKLNQYMGNTATIKIIYDYNADNFDHSNLDFIGGSQLYSEGCERAPITSVEEMKDEGRQDLGPGWKDEIGRNWDSHRLDRHRGRVDPVRGQLPRPRPELPRQAGAARCYGSPSTGTTTSGTCGASSPSAPRRS